MSYILDALRRADAERGRGAVPGLHTQATPANSLSAQPDRAGATNLWLVAAGAVGVAAVAAGGTWWALRPQAPAVVASAPVAAAPVPAPAAAPAPAVVARDLAPPPAALPPSVLPSAPPSPAVAPAPAAEPRAANTRSPDKRNAPPPRERERERSVAPVVVPSPPPRPAAVEPTRPRSAATAPAPAALPAATKTAPEAAQQPPSGAPVFTAAELPEALRTQLPTLKVTGATYSTNPAYRMAIVNGQVLHEGDQAAPGLVLERVEPGRTVWAFRGYRYAVAAQ